MVAGVNTINPGNRWNEGGYLIFSWLVNNYMSIRGNENCDATVKLEESFFFDGD